MVSKGDIDAYILLFAIHGISAILGKPEIVKSFLRNITSWKGLRIINLTLEEKILACELGEKYGLDFDDSLQYYTALKMNIPIVSFDHDFDEKDVIRLEPKEIT